MKITFIYHSCYIVEVNDCVLIFDYYKGVLPSIAKNKKVYFFVSHSHYDHFNDKIFDMYRDNECHFILSSDCFVEESENRHVMFANENFSLNELEIYTLQSTDLGVAFLIKVGSTVIYHAGDLNAWCFEENDDKTNEYMKNMYSSEISCLRDVKIDIAFIPFDSRLGKNASLGLDIFLNYNIPEYIFPMHVNGDYNCIKEYLIAHKEKTHLQPVFQENFVFIR